MTLLDGIRVVVLADHLADFGGSMLARLGAEVVLADAAPLTAPRAKAWHKSMTRSDAPLETLLEGADILIDDRRTDPREGVDDLAARHEALIHVVVTGFPNDMRPVTDLTLMAQSGLMHVTGQPDRPPLRLPGEQGYALTGIQTATAALMGLRARRLTGKGQRITLSAVQSAALANYREAVMYDQTGRIGTRRGNMLVRGKSGVRQIWPCADGYVTWSMIDNPGMMRAIVRVMEEEGVAGELANIDWDDILVADTDQEVIDRWQGIVETFFARHDRKTLADWSLEHGWGLSPIIRLSEVPETPQMKARGVFDADGVPGPLFAVHPGGAT
ncbi:CoA transferase [Maritimibacter sp. UBA3975]|uniref:CoA transferase n=1 Tax=Maritimibacter sp. UBA3975 TaxID=1946833 RepID=UPI000C09F5C4|nr:CoA transferase [Maritimibacter sp. UBA3975]MAM60252.1 carnitine dehydratase [Maritimibacter sp.]|tara:strand:- start:11528 stop:12514 length:987 start_codon:yes stop_codon:yes gene_type:complete